MEHFPYSYSGSPRSLEELNISDTKIGIIFQKINKKLKRKKKILLKFNGISRKKTRDQRAFNPGDLLGSSQKRKVMKMPKKKKLEIRLRERACKSSDLFFFC